MTHEFHKIYRPKKFSEVIGQPEAVKVLLAHVKRNTVPHAILLSGPSGCGKTTLARILKSKMHCGDRDFIEVNAANYRGIDDIRKILSRTGYRATDGKCRIFLIDEVHQLTKEAQNCFLKQLEDAEAHVYYFLATTDPGKLLPTIKTRCTPITLKAISQTDLKALIKSTAEKAEIKISDDVIDRIIEVADGSARAAVMLLDKVRHTEDEEEALDAILKSSERALAIEIARTLLNPRCTWRDICAKIKNCDEEPEGIRRLVLAYMTNVMLNGAPISARAFFIINCFRDNYFDVGKAGLVESCYRCTTK